MKKLILCIGLLCLCSSAKAWTLPDYGYTYFVGTAEELDDIRAAIRQAECERLGPEMTWCVLGGPFCGYSVGCHQIPNPYCGDNTYPCGQKGNVIPESFGTEPLDCMRSYEDYVLWPSESTMGELYLGNTYGGTYVPAAEELSTQGELPTECITYMEQFFCLAGSGWEDLVCPDP